jgi:ferrochelatase
MENKDSIYYSNETKSKVAIVLLQMGGPYNIDLVKPFLLNLFKDGDIIQLPFFLRPFQGLIAKMIVRKRGKFVIENYKLIGGGSPIFNHTSGLAKRIFESFKDKGMDVDVTFVMRYSEPRANVIIEKLKRKGIDRVILFPLYPHYSHATTGSSVKDFKKYAKKSGYSPEIIEINDWGLEQFYVSWWTKELKNNLDEDKNNIKLLFTAHGLPQKYIEKGDPYLESLKPCVEKIMNEFPDYQYKLAFQSNVGPVEWLRPYTTDAIKELKNGTESKLVFIPIGFVSDHIETLQEIDILYKSQAEEVGYKSIKRIKVPNDSAEFAEGVVNYLNSYLG